MPDAEGREMAIAELDDDEPALKLPGSSIPRQILWLALPVLVEQSLLYLIGFSDTVLTGRYLAVEHLAAVTVSAYLLWFLGSLMMIVSVGATALVARSVGAGKWGEAVRVCGQSIGLAWAFGLAILAVGWLAAPAIIHGLNLRGPAASEATAFLRIVLTITPLLASTTVGIACLRGAGDTRTGMWVMLVVNIINAALSWALVVGWLGLPRLGLRGVATGTAVGEGVGGLLVLAVLARGRSGLRMSWSGLAPTADIARRLLRVSLPAAGEGTANGLCQLWFLGVINRLGETATAAHGVAIRCEAIAFLTLAAFAVPASTLTGQYLGARRPDLAARAAKTAWGMGLVVATGLGGLVYLAAGPMFALFLGRAQPGVAELGAPVLRIVAFALPALATINVLNGALRGAGDTRWPLAIVLLGYLIVRMPLTYLLATPTGLGGWGWGLKGAWVAMFIDLCVRGTLVAGRFLQGGWRWVRI